MAALETVLQKNVNTQSPVLVKVIAVSSTRSFRDNQNKEQQIVTAAFAAGDTAIRASVYEPHITTVLPGRYLIITHYSVHNRAMILRRKCCIYRTHSTMTVTARAEQAANEIIHPSSTALSIPEVLQQQIAGLVSVTGTIDTVSNFIILHNNHNIPQITTAYPLKYLTSKSSFSVFGK